MEQWIEEILDKMKATLKSCPCKEDGEWAKERLCDGLGAVSGYDAWSEKGPIRIDIWFEKDGNSVAIETEVSAISASHDLLKLAYVKPDIAFLVLNDLDSGTGPRRSTFERLTSRIRTLRSCRSNEHLARAFQELKIIVIGVRYKDETAEIPYEVKHEVFL